jgi:uncharacterized protein involved in high-affinity Fe2+ transport
MRRRWWIRPALTALALGLPLLAAGARAGPGPLVGVEQVKDMQIALFAWPAEKGIVLPPLHSHPHGEGEPAGPPTHHIEVTVFDTIRRMNIPYLNVTATFQNRLTSRSFTVDLLPMIGNTFHYGDNVALVKGNRYSILLDIRPPELMRSQQQKDVWTTPARVVFEYDYR